MHNYSKLLLGIVSIALLITLPNSSADSNNRDCLNLRVNEFCIANLTNGNINDLEYSPDGEFIGIVGPFFRATLINMPDGSIHKVSTNNNTFGNAISFSPNGQFVAVGGQRGISLWNVLTDSHQFFDLNESISALDYSPDAQIIAYGTADGEIGLLDIDSGDIIAAAIDNTRPFASSIIDITFSPDGLTIGSNSTEASRLWSAVDLSIQQTLVDNLNLPLGNIDFSPDGNFLAHGDKVPSVPLWDIQDQSEPDLVRRFPTMANGDLGASAAVFAPDGRQIVVGAFDYDEGTPALRLWNLNTGQATLELLGIGNAIDHVSFSPDGAYVAGVTNSLSGSATSNHVIVWLLE